jgi:hypothetical protein
MKKITSPILLLLIVFAVLFLSACSVIRNQLLKQTATVAEATDVPPTPITIPTQLRSQTQVDVQTCLVAQKTAIQTNKPQGDLIAWAPDTDNLAFVQPVNQYSGWYVGDILIYDAVHAKESLTSVDQTVFGDLTWSPDGNSLAYVLLNQHEGIYTVKILTLANGLSVDIFGDVATARTDAFASLKGIQEWPSAPNLIVTSYCGTDCVRLFQYNAISAKLNQQNDIRQNDDTSLTITNEYYSPNGKWQVTVDDKNNVWLSSETQNRVSLLLTGIPVSEIKWSKDSTYLAIRTADQVQIYKAGCTSN